VGKGKKGVPGAWIETDLRDGYGETLFSNSFPKKRRVNLGGRGGTEGGGISVLRGGKKKIVSGLHEGRGESTRKKEVKKGR